MKLLLTNVSKLRSTASHAVRIPLTPDQYEMLIKDALPVSIETKSKFQDEDRSLKIINEYPTWKKSDTNAWVLSDTVAPYQTLISSKDVFEISDYLIGKDIHVSKPLVVQEMDLFERTPPAPSLPSVKLLESESYSRLLARATNLLHMSNGCLVDMLQLASVLYPISEGFETVHDLIGSWVGVKGDYLIDILKTNNLYAASLELLYEEPKDGKAETHTAPQTEVRYDKYSFEAIKKQLTEIIQNYAPFETPDDSKAEKAWENYTGEQYQSELHPPKKQTSVIVSVDPVKPRSPLTIWKRIGNAWKAFKVK